MALAAGLALGLVAHASGSGWSSSLASLVRPAGELWVAALQATVLPLAVAHLLAAVIGAGERGSFGVLGGQAVALFVTMLAVAALLTMAVGPGVVALYPVNRETIAALSAATSVPESARAAAAAAPGSPGDWVAGLMPSNLLEAARNGEILPLLLFSVALGMAVRRLPDDQREPLSRAITGLAAAMLIVVRWILWLTPLGVFAFIFLATLGAGGAAAGMLAAFVVIQSGAMLLVTALLYP
ncbi:MAG: cation:dicarboxylate symporter family transporter, partial [Gemmatimonadaceae bacterium]